jgi:threonine dehydrogenase-like Zn-dependent dehydrogenase
MLKKRIGGAGTLCLMGLFEQPNLTLDVSALMYKAGRIFAEWGLSEGPKSIEDSLSMLSRGKVRPSEWITHRFPEDRADEAMNLLVAKRDNAIGVEIVR